MASPTLATWSHSRTFAARYSPMPAIQPATTAAVPCCELVGRWSNLVEMVVPSDQTPPIFDIVAPQSVPMKICLVVLMAGECTSNPRPREWGAASAIYVGGRRAPRRAAAVSGAAGAGGDRGVLASGVA